MEIRQGYTSKLELEVINDNHTFFQKERIKLAVLYTSKTLFQVWFEWLIYGSTSLPGIQYGFDLTFASFSRNALKGCSKSVMRKVLDQGYYAWELQTFLFLLPIWLHLNPKVNAQEFFYTINQSQPGKFVSTPDMSFTTLIRTFRRCLHTAWI